MPKVRPGSSSGSGKRIRPALTPEAREQQLIGLAVDLVEKRLLEGTASSQEVTHFLKLASTREKMERDILREQAKLIKAKTQNLESVQEIKDLYANALQAMRAYTGSGRQEDE